jgi:hypothetical protein
MELKYPPSYVLFHLLLSPVVHSCRVYDIFMYLPWLFKYSVYCKFRSAIL